MTSNTNTFVHYENIETELQSIIHVDVVGVHIELNDLQGCLVQITMKPEDARRIAAKLDALLYHTENPARRTALEPQRNSING